MSKPAKAQAIIQHLESMSPKKLAEDWDPIGLQLGSYNKTVTKVMVTLDVIEPVVDEAIKNDVDLIIAHHPLVFTPIKKLNVDTPYGRTIQKLIKHDITVYAAHTNLDVAKGGVNDIMSQALGIKNLSVLAPTTEDKLKKLVVFVPKENADSLREALGNAGAGHIGEYSHCTFNSPGQGTFKPGENTNPHIGEQGKLEFVNEVKIETIFPESIQSNVLNAMIKAHPYEEVAYDIYSLENKGEELGLGRIGELPTEMKLSEFANHVKQAFDVKGVRVVGNLDGTVKKVAVLGGDGNSYVKQAIFKGADVYVTGDIKYHIAHDAMLDGLNIVDPGHNVEKLMKDSIANYLKTFVTDKKYDTEVIVSKVNTDPFQFV